MSKPPVPFGLQTWIPPAMPLGPTDVSNAPPSRMHHGTGPTGAPRSSHFEVGGQLLAGTISTVDVPVVRSGESEETGTWRFDHSIEYRPGVRSWAATTT